MNAITGFQTVASPALRAIMDDRQPAAIRLRQVAAQMHGKIEAGNFRRLPACELVEMRAIVFALHDVADKLMEPPEPMKPARKWWRVWL
jgi:hypothetical protein